MNDFSTDMKIVLFLNYIRCSVNAFSHFITKFAGSPLDRVTILPNSLCILVLQYTNRR